MDGVCGANCNDCELMKNNNCKGCKKTNGCPFGKKCWIAKYIELGGKDNFEILKKQLINEINSLNIDGMSSINELYPLHGTFVNLEYILPNGEKVKFLSDTDLYLGNQVECIINDENTKKCFGVVSNMDFIMVSIYEENGINPELLVYKKR